jgi:hypothetical protein
MYLTLMIKFSQLFRTQSSTKKYWQKLKNKKVFTILSKIQSLNLQGKQYPKLKYMNSVMKINR